MSAKDIFQKVKLKFSGRPDLETVILDSELAGGDVGNKYVHYEGPLGTFDYDPKEFSMRTITIPAGNGFEGGMFSCLQYIGNETDGSKIHIPEGITDVSFMFAGNRNLESMPELPDSAEVMHGTCMGCSNMKKAVKSITAREAGFLFYGCSSMEKGPSVMDVENGQYAFGECSSMKNTPKLREGLINGEYMFAGCSSMEKEVDTPSTMRYRKNMMANCDKILDAKAKERQTQQDKAASKYMNKISRSSMRERAVSALTFLVQAKAMYSDTHSLVYSLFRTHSLRSRHIYSNTFDGRTLGMMAGRQSNVLGKIIRNQAQSKMQAERADRAQWSKDHPNEPYKNMHDRERQAKIQQKMDEWTRAHYAYASDTKSEQSILKGLLRHYNVQSLETIGKRDMSENETVKAAIQSPVELKAASYDNLLSDTYGGTSEDREACAKYFADQMAAYANYSHCMESEVNKESDASKRESMREGLSRTSEMQVSFLMDNIKTLQAKYGVFTEAQMQRIDDSFSKTVYGRNHSEESLAQSGFVLSSEERVAEDKKSFMSHLYSYARTQQADGKQQTADTTQVTPSSRGEEAQQRFGQSADYDVEFTDDAQLV